MKMNHQKNKLIAGIVIAVILTPVMLLTQKCNGQISLPINQDTKQVEYSEVVTADTLSASTLFSNLKIFIGQAAKDAKHIIQTEDDASKTMVIKGNLRILFKHGMAGYQYSGWANNVVTVACKDGRYKYTVSDIVYTCETNGVRKDSPSDTPIESDKMNVKFAGKKVWYQVKEETDTSIKDFIADLKKGMIKKPDNW